MRVFTNQFGPSIERNWIGTTLDRSTVAPPVSVSFYYFIDIAKILEVFLA